MSWLWAQDHLTLLWCFCLCPSVLAVICFLILFSAFVLLLSVSVCPCSYILLIFHHTGVEVAPNGCSLSLKDLSNSNGSSSTMQINSRLVIDCMGHGSPIVQQIRYYCGYCAHVAAQHMMKIVSYCDGLRGPWVPDISTDQVLLSKLCSL